MLLCTRDLYGDANVGHIVTFGTLKPKNCIADVGRILNIPLNEVAMLKKCIPDDDLKITLKDADGTSRVFTIPMTTLLTLNEVIEM